MSNPVAAPAQHKQPSRKGKKAWRKNVDVTQVQEGLQEVREQLATGGIIAEKAADELFIVDAAGSKDIQNEYRKKHKTLKVDEILNARSAVPAVSSRKRGSSMVGDGIVKPKPKKARVSAKDLDRIRSIAYGGDQVHKDVVKIGDAATHDPWAETDPQPSPYTFLDAKKPIREPETLKHAPISLAASGKPLPAVRKPEAGKSYNPLLDDWAELVEREGQKEVEAELKRRQEAQEEAERQARIEAARAEEELESDNAESAWESEWEGIESEVEGSGLNKKRPERKTPAQRNKIKRRKEAERKAIHDAKIKERERQLQRIKELAKATEEKEKIRAMKMATVQEDVSSDEEEVLRKKRFGKAGIPEAPLEVVLADELQDSLRRLKPEGNLLKDRFRSMVVRGKIESRKQIAQGKKNKTTVTEKWTYKDWKLK
ncbi:P60-like protein [Delitschia confertaspora ATCC 74209]|uniref:Ribosome biogenesis protein NOP53 n=1 Tax=Delitschia confertaspora ATCC 74209 TaxID=1513339 RepID=A0A9P4JI98_9PLEO|nr:P60-like protein [Delitschia confertaspora ATCC 74209]